MQFAFRWPFRASSFLERTASLLFTFTVAEEHWVWIKVDHSENHAGIYHKVICDGFFFSESTNSWHPQHILHPSWILHVQSLCSIALWVHTQHISSHSHCVPIWENYYEVQGYSPFATCGNDQCRSKDLCVLTSAALPSTISSSPLHAPSPLLLQAPRCQAWIHHAHHCTRCEVASPQVEAMQARHGPVCLKRLLSRTDENAEQTRVSRLLSTMLAVYELQAQQGRDGHFAFDGEYTDWHL